MQSNKQIFHTTNFKRNNEDSLWITLSTLSCPQRIFIVSLQLLQLRTMSLQPMSNHGDPIPLPAQAKIQRRRLLTNYQNLLYHSPQPMWNSKPSAHRMPSHSSVTRYTRWQIHVALLLGNSQIHQRPVRISVALVLHQWTLYRQWSLWQWLWHSDCPLDFYVYPTWITCENIQCNL